MGNCPPVVWMSHKHGDRCAGCGAEIWKGALIQISQEGRIHCAECAGLEDLLFLPSGDTALTRRALALSPRSAVAHVRHRHTPYDALLRGVEPHDARPRVAGAVEQRLGEWRGSAEE